MTAWLRQILILCALITSLAACSDGSVTVGVGIPPPLPIPGNEAVTSTGIITALNSVTVNDVRYDTANATVIVNGRIASATDLRLGQAVRLEGEIGVLGVTGTSDSVTYRATVIGPIDTVDANAGQVAVMGQRVTVNDRTEYGPGINPVSLKELSVGAILQVSGLRRANGDIASTRIELDPAAGQFQIIGEVAELDLANMRFSVDGLIVDYASASVIEIPGSVPANELTLAVMGSLVSGVLIASELRAAFDSNLGSPYARTHAHGYVTRFSSASDFSVNSYPITTDFDTDYLGGSISDLQLDTEITVDGRVAGDGESILADQIRFGQLPNPTRTLTYGFADFDEILVTSVFDVTVTQAPEYLVEVTIDEDVVDRLVVTQTDHSLQLGLQSGRNDVQTIKANVTLPTLNRIELDGVIRASLDGFKQPQLDVALRGVSFLRGHSSLFTNLTASVSGVSNLDFGALNPISVADIDLAKVSKATLNMAVGSSLAGSVNGTSLLLYYGTNVSLDVTADLTSAVVKLGETKP